MRGTGLSFGFVLVAAACGGSVNSGDSNGTSQGVEESTSSDNTLGAEWTELQCLPVADVAAHVGLPFIVLDVSGLENSPLPVAQTCIYDTTNAVEDPSAVIVSQYSGERPGPEWELLPGSGESLMASRGDGMCHVMEDAPTRRSAFIVAPGRGFDDRFESHCDVALSVYEKHFGVVG